MQASLGMHFLLMNKSWTQVLRAKAKIKAFAFGKHSAKGAAPDVTLALSNNTIEVLHLKYRGPDIHALPEVHAICLSVIIAQLVGSVVQKYRESRRSCPHSCPHRPFISTMGQLSHFLCLAIETPWDPIGV